jgi:HK97 family phage major capsid protein
MSELNDLVVKLSQQIEKASSDFSNKSEEAMKMAKEQGQLNAQMKDEVDRMMSELNAMNSAHKTLTDSLDGLEQHVAAMPLNRSTEIAQTVGQQLLGHDSLKALNSTIKFNQNHSFPVQMEVTTPDFPAGVVEPDRRPGIDTAPQQRLFIRDLIAPGKTESNMIFYIQETGFTNAAAAVPENTLKPESDIEFAEKTTPVRTIAHTFNASKQILDDFKQLSSLVDKNMRYGLKLVEEAEILFGDGTGAHLEGIIPQASAFDPDFNVPAQTGIDDLRLAMLQAQLARYPATGHVMHFIDWAKIELTKDELGRYILANPSGLASPTLWGLPVVQTETPAFVGKFLTGAFRMGAQLFDREQANVVISTENRDNFEKNMITIRCEERLALAVYRPEAFIFGGFSGAVSS